MATAQIDWKGIRELLGFTQGQMARRVCLRREHLSRIETGRYRPRQGTVELLKKVLQDPEIRGRLEGAGMAWPWPEESQSAAAEDLVAAAPKAGQRCRSCRILIGPGHVEKVSHDGYCSACDKERRLPAPRC